LLKLTKTQAKEILSAAEEGKTYKVRQYNKILNQLNSMVERGFVDSKTDPLTFGAVLWQLFHDAIQASIDEDIAAVGFHEGFNSCHGVVLELLEDHACPECITEINNRLTEINPDFWNMDETQTAGALLH